LAQAVYDSNLPQQPLPDTLRAIGAKAGVNVVFDPEAVHRKTSVAIRGSYSAQEAVRKALDGTGLSYRATTAGSLIVETAGPPGAGAPSEPENVIEVVATGTHIPGVELSSPIISVTQQQITDSGQTDLGEFARSIPQSFGGGQNPSQNAGNGGPAANTNNTGASSFNLRGLGPDATLTLLNGHRLPYNGDYQAIDVSQIPLAAVNRVDILLDGSSAVYGSDAVAGVVDIIMKPDFDGLTVSARGGGTPDGGDGQEQYSLVGGKTWTGGGVIATYNYDRNTDILTSQRSYSDNVQGPTTLYPSILEQSGLISGHQEIYKSLTFSVDAGYSERSNKYITNEDPAVQYSNSAMDRSYWVAPRLELELPKSWVVSIDGVTSEDNSNNNILEYTPAGALAFHSLICYCNIACNLWRRVGMGPSSPSPEET
jgi:outer membrane receptor protein involved in Fe transport